MSIWGHRDSEPPAGEHESEPGARDTQEPAAEYQAGEPAEPEHQAGEPAPAFWRIHGETSASFGREAADAPPPDYGYVPGGAPAAEDPAPADGQSSGEAAAPAVSEAPAGTDAPVPVLTGKVVVLDGETAVKDPPLTGTAGDQAWAYDAEASPAATGAQEPPLTAVPEPSATDAPEPSVTDAAEPAVTAAPEPPPVSDSGITPQRWSEILVAFVDDPRASVKMAADAVDEAVDEFVNSVRARQQALASSWQGTEAGTEQLRTALRDYRRFWHQVQQLDLGGKTGG